MPSGVYPRAPGTTKPWKRVATHEKLCTFCDQVKDREKDFGKKAGGAAQSYCKPCHVAYTIIWRQRERLRAQLRKQVA